ncbi:MAG: TIGR00282 family metallophosphoesterase [Dehalococcoidia bacterium]|nr:TIGR00282 family metallophosphoesterase [Dehalococcoidia bacterium]
MRILMVGDVIGRPGRRALEAFLPDIRREHAVDLVVANGENAAGGFGITADTAREMLDAGVDVITTGNHVWDQKEARPLLATGELPILRPANYPPDVPGRGYLVVGGVLVVNLMGRVFMEALDCPFRTMDRTLSALESRPKAVVVDFHAEATSEKQAMAWYLDGRVGLVAGTHTHVPTADPRILPGGTAAVTDLGMTGPVLSVIGMEPQSVLERFLTQMPRRFTVAGGPVKLNAVLVEIDPETGRARSLVRVDREEE